MYHIIDSIRYYGAVNGYTTETYESLHKYFVKIPYRISNKKNIETQLLQTVGVFFSHSSHFKIYIYIFKIGN